MSGKGDYVAHSVKGSAVKVCQQGLFLSNPDGLLGRKKVRYRFRKYCLAEVDVSDLKYRRRHWVGHSREGQVSQDTVCGTGIVAVGMGTGEQAE